MKTKKLIAIIVFIILLLVCIYLLYDKTNFFLIKNIQINYTNSVVNKYEIETNIRSLNSLSSIKYFNIKSNSLIQEIKNSSSFISSVYITKELPNTLMIYLTLKQPSLSLEIEQNRCILLEENGDVLLIETNNCENQVKIYNTILVKSDDPKLEFSVNQKSNYTQQVYIQNTIKVFNKYNLAIKIVDIKDNVAIFSDNKNRTYVFSFNQDIEVQQARLISVFGQLTKKDYKYNHIDLRFNRPILVTK